MTKETLISHNLYPTYKVTSESGKIYLVNSERESCHRVYHDPAGEEATRKKLDVLLSTGEETGCHKIGSLSHPASWSDVEAYIASQEPAPVQPE